VTRSASSCVSHDDCLGFIKAVEAHHRTFDLEQIARWAFVKGYQFT
jgi:hypothetical protein